MTDVLRLPADNAAIEPHSKPRRHNAVASCVIFMRTGANAARFSRELAQDLPNWSLAGQDRLILESLHYGRGDLEITIT